MAQYEKREMTYQYEEPTRQGILRDYLGCERGQLREVSKNATCLEPLPGKEERWELLRKRCGLIEDMIKALDTETVRAAMADWQERIVEEDKAGKAHQLTL